MNFAAGSVAVSTEARLQRTPDGAVWTKVGPAHAFWTRYLSAFDQVRLIARVADVEEAQPGWSRVDGSGVAVWPLPYYIGPVHYLLRRRALRRSLAAAVDDVAAVILRVPSPIAVLAVPILRRQRRAYAVEVVGDPQDVLSRGVIRHPARPLLRRWAVGRLRDQCRYAVGAAYVTQHHLQHRYPPGPNTVAAVYSSVDLRGEAFVEQPWSPPAGRPATLVSVGSLEQMYKGVDVLLHAMSQLGAAGRHVRLVHVGDGRFRPRLERLIGRHGLTDRVTLTGDLPTSGVRDWLDRADLFVLPSRTEGLPRALIEAMARGLPVVATSVGGTPELLEPDCLVPAGDPVALASVIGLLLDDPQRMARTAQRNLDRARDYRAEILAPRRAAFYRTVRIACRPASVAPAVLVRDHVPAS